MAFKMKGFQAHDESPMKVGGKLSNWAADNKAFIDKEIQDRRKASGAAKDKDEDKNKTTTNKNPKTTTTTVANNNNKEKVEGRVEFADANPELQKYVQQEEGKIVDGVYQPGEKSLKNYTDAFNDMENKTVDGRTMKYNPENKKYYEDSKEGQSEFETDAETWYKKHHEKDKSKNLNIDSQTDKQSTHEVWK